MPSTVMVSLAVGFILLARNVFRTVERLLIGLAQKWGSLDQPNPTGELYAIDANGNRGELLVGYRVESNGPGTRIQPKKVEAVAAFLAEIRSPLNWWADNEAVAWREDGTEAGPGRILCAAVQPLEPSLGERIAQASGDPVVFMLAQRSLIEALTQDLDADVVVIGGGFSGINTALELAEKGITNIVVLEGRHLG